MNMSLRSARKQIRKGGRIVLPLFLILGCEKKDAPISPEQQQAALLARGKAVYSTSCTACHNIDPKLPGAIGPEVSGSSKELLEARVLTATYPPGYQPKRNTHQMAALPQLKYEIEALYLYLNSQK